MCISIRRLVLLLGSLSLGFVVGCGDLPNRDPGPLTRGRSGCDARPTTVDSARRDSQTAPDSHPVSFDAADSTGEAVDGGLVVDTIDGGAEPMVPDTQVEDTFVSTDPDCADAGDNPSQVATVIVLPDTQYYSAYYPTIFNAQVNYILNQRGPRNIAGVLHVGDVVDDIFSDSQWVAAAKALRPLDNVLPYILVPGNHDQDGNRKGLMDNYFPPDTMPWITGTMVPGQSENTYTLLDIGPRKWLVMALEFGPRNNTLVWADGILKAFPTLPAILLTHAYLYDDGTRYDWAAKGSNQLYNPHWYNPTPDEGVNDGEEMYKKLVVPNPNIRLVFSGHMNTTPWALARRTDLRPQGGAPVHQMLQDFQSNTNGGDGYLRILEFDYGTGEIRVDTYSPTLDKYIADNTGRFTLPLVP